MQDNNRIPALHATSHKRNGSDQILLDELGVPTDVTNLNATASYHGLSPKLSGNYEDVLHGDGTYNKALRSYYNGSLISNRSKLNFIEGTSVTLSVQDDVTNGRTNVIINSIAGAGGDATAWHNTGDTFGADKIIGAMDASGGYAVKFYVENQEMFRIVDDGDNLNWTGPRIKVGHTGAAFYPNGDIISIQKDLSDQLCVTLRNTHSTAGQPSGASYVVIDDTGTIAGGVNVMNSNWPNPQDGVYAGEVCFLAFGGPCVLGTQTDADLRFITQNAERMRWDNSASEFQISGGDVIVSAGDISVSGNIDSTGGVIRALAAASGLQIGDKAGSSNYLEYLDDSGNGEVTLRAVGKGSRFMYSRIVSGAASASGYGAALWVTNADAKHATLFMPETGFSESHLAKASYATLSVSAGYGWRINVNATNNSGIRIESDGTLHHFGSAFTYNLFPEGGSGVGSIGSSGAKWSDVYVVNAVHVGDVHMSDEAMGSDWVLREAKIQGEDVDTLYAINGRTGKKYKVMLESV
jgi:hypothetical protein